MKNKLLRLLYAVLIVHIFGVFGWLITASYFFMWIFRVNAKATFKLLLAMIIGTSLSMIVILLELFLLLQPGSIINPIGGDRFTNNQENSYKIGQTFYFDLQVTARKQSINFVTANLAFDKEVLEVRRIETNQGFATIFLNKYYSNETGVIDVQGGLPKPGFLGENGLFVRIYFNAKKSGVTEIKITPASKIYANDGLGTQLLNDFASFRISVIE